MTFDEWWKEQKKKCKTCDCYTVDCAKCASNKAWDAAQNQYKDKIDKVLDHLNLSPVERHTVDILITEDIL